MVLVTYVFGTRRFSKTLIGSDSLDSIPYIGTYFYNKFPRSRNTIQKLVQYVSRYRFPALIKYVQSKCTNDRSNQCIIPKTGMRRNKKYHVERFNKYAVSSILQTVVSFSSTATNRNAYNRWYQDIFMNRRNTEGVKVCQCLTEQQCRRNRVCQFNRNNGRCEPRGLEDFGFRKQNHRDHPRSRSQYTDGQWVPPVNAPQPRQPRRTLRRSTRKRKQKEHIHKFTSIKKALLSKTVRVNQKFIVRGRQYKRVHKRVNPNGYERI